MISRLLLLSLLISLTLPVAGSALAQPVDTGRAGDVAPFSSPNRHNLSFGFGVLPNAQAGLSNFQDNGLRASLSYTFLLHPEWGLEANASLLETELASGFGASVATVLLGANYYPEALALGSIARSYLSGAVGPCVAQTGSDSRFVDFQRQAVAGARLGAGIDTYTWDWLRLGLGVSYHATPGYDGELGTIQSASGTQISMKVGVSFGSR